MAILIVILCQGNLINLCAKCGLKSQNIGLTNLSLMGAGITYDWIKTVPKACQTKIICGLRKKREEFLRAGQAKSICFLLVFVHIHS
jgi:hypothetical protein